MGSLAPFQLKNIYFIPRNKSLMVKSLLLPQIKPLADSYDYEAVRQVRNFYLAYIEQQAFDLNLGERIYLSRKKAGRKHVINEDAVETLLISYGFTIINNEDYTFLEQVAIYSQANCLVSIHGSGLTNMLFMGEGSKILELTKANTNELDHPSFVFWYQAEALGFHYYHQICDEYRDCDYFFGDFMVDIELLEINLNRMFPEKVSFTLPTVNL